MDSQEWKKKSGQIPAFGNWDLANDMPITQYFDCPRQAGLLRYSNSSSTETETETDLYALHFHKPKPLHNSSNKHKNQGTKNRERRCPVGGNGMVKEKDEVNVIITRKQGKVNDVVAEQPRKPIRVSKKKQVHQNDTVPRSPPHKPVDEDLYKISPDLLRTTKRVEEYAGFHFKVSCTCCLHFMSDAMLQLPSISNVIIPMNF